MIFNYYIIPTMIIGLVISITREVFLVSDFTKKALRKNIITCMNIDVLNNVIIPNRQNTLVMSFWVVRTFEDRDIMLEDPERYFKSAYINLSTIFEKGSVV